MSGYVQSGPVAATSGAGTCTPGITGVTLNNALLCTYTTDDQSTLVPPTDSSGQTWGILAQFTVGGSTLQAVAVAYLLGAAAGTHNLTWASQVVSATAQIHEVNGPTSIVGAGTPVTVTNDPTGTSTLTCGPYTPGSASEFVIAIFNEEGSSSSEGVRCTTAIFQTIGSSSDAGSHPCLMIQQDGINFMGAEANAVITLTASPISATWTWSTTNVATAMIAGIPMPGAPPPPMPTSYTMEQSEYY